MTNNALDEQCKIAHLRRLIAENESRQDALEKRQDQLFEEWGRLLLELEYALLRYDDARAAPRLREQGAAAVEAVVEHYRRMGEVG